MQGKLLVFEDFADKVGHDFVLGDPTVATVSLCLKEAEPFKRRAAANVRTPFSLIFLAKDERVLPQGIYRIAHEKLGALEIFIVPIGKDAEGVSYQATFN